MASQPLYEGWNELTWQFQDIDREYVDCALDLATGNKSGDGNWIALAQFNGQWDVIFNDPTLPPEFSTLDELVAGEQYWISTKFGGTIVFSNAYKDPSC